MTTTASRHRLPWSMTETNRLYSEYEMKQLPISSIAQLHARTEYAILHKLAQECLINASWNDVKGWNNAPKEMKQNKVVYDYDEDCESEYEEDDHDSDSDYEESVADEEGSVVSESSLEDCDDPNDSDYVDEGEDEEDDDDSSDYDEEEEFDAYSIPQKASSIKKLIDAAKFFLYAA